MIPGKLDLCISEKEESPGRADVEALGRVLMSIMEKTFDSNRNFGIQNPDHWSQNVLDFLSCTVEGPSVDHMRHPFLKISKGEELAWLVLYALRTARSIVGEN